MQTKKIVGACIVCGMMVMGFVRWAKVTFQPQYSDVRFQPADQLHAGCTNSADILLSSQGQKITKFTLVLYYDPDQLEILRILPTDTTSITSSKIEYNKITLEVQNPSFTSSTQAKSFFQIDFKSDTAGQENISLGTGSDAVIANKIMPLAGIFTMNFVQVPECQPDIVPPNINLIYPKDTIQRIHLDQYFIFDIKDIGKWVDKNSVIINFDGDKYFSWSENMKRNGDYLTFYPSKRIPIDKTINLKISVADQQVYGWPNTTASAYTFMSATGMSLNKEISPLLFRMIAQEASKISASPNECALLADYYTKAQISYQQELKSILQKVWCDLSTIDTSLLSPDTNVVQKNTQQKNYTNISVFATIWWILFFITFVLKMHYLLAYKKHKKANEKLKMK